MKLVLSGAEALLISVLRTGERTPAQIQAEL